MQLNRNIHPIHQYILRTSTHSQNKFPKTQDPLHEQIKNNKGRTEEHQNKAQILHQTDQ